MAPLDIPQTTPPPAPPPPPAAGPPTNTAPPAQLTSTWISLDRWCRSNGVPARAVNTPAGPAFTLTGRNGSFELRPGTRIAHWNGLEIRLAFAPQLAGGDLQVHALDLSKTLQPLLVSAPATFADTNLVVVIDPGHGGTDSGARSVLGYAYEKDYTLDWARRLGWLLVTNGWRVYLTRTGDTDLALSNRIAFAESHKAGLFISLHFNSSAPNDQQAGLETYCLTPTGMPSTVTREFGDDTALVFPNNTYDAQNLQLALRAHRALLQVNGRKDRGVRRARFLGVLRGQRCPAILIEGGYLSNPQEARRIADPAYRQKLAEAVAKALE